MSVNYKKIIADALLSLLCSMPLRKIKIKDIIEASGVSRQTFYNHFENRNALFTWIYRTRIIADADPLDPPTDFYDNILSYYKNLYSYRSFIIAAAKLDETYSLRDIMEDFSLEWFAHYLENFHSVPEVSHLEFAIRYNVHGFVGATLAWILGGMEIAPERMAFYLYRSTPAILQAYLPAPMNALTRESLQCGFANPQFYKFSFAKNSFNRENRSVCDRFAMALVQMCEERPITSITVQDLLDKTKTGRQTFYSNFRDKNALIQWTFRHHILYLSPDGADFEECWVRYFRQLEQYKHFISQAGDLSGHNCLREYMRSCSEEWYRKQYYLNYGSDLIPLEISYAIRFHAYGIVDSIIDWSKFRYSASPESIAKWVCACQPRQMLIYPFIQRLNQEHNKNQFLA